MLRRVHRLHVVRRTAHRQQRLQQRRDHGGAVAGSHRYVEGVAPVEVALGCLGGIVLRRCQVLEYLQSQG